MKYLNTYKIFEATLVDKKIQLLKDLALELQDIGLQVEVANGSYSPSTVYLGKFIVMKITDDNGRFDTDLYNTEIIDDFKETLKSYGMNPRSMVGGRNFCVFKFDKHSHMTNSPIIRESKSNRDSIEEILDNIEEIFREIEDIGFSVENIKDIDNISFGPHKEEDTLMSIWIEDFDNESVNTKYYPTNEFVDALLHLKSYVTEFKLDYRIEIHDDCEVIDVLESESEIEKMVSWGNPIDYIKIIISYKEDLSSYYKSYKFPGEISESLKPEYNDDWKKPNNPIREMLEVELREILLEVIDLGYRPQLGGFISGFSKNPYVWISNQKRLSHVDFWNEISDTVERVKDYLISKGFKVNQEIINEGRPKEQVSIYFDFIN